MAAVILLLAVGAVALAAASAGPSDYFTKENIASVAAVAEREASRSVRDAFFGAGALRALDVDLKAKGAVCKLAKETLASSGAGAAAVHQAAGAAAAAGCLEAPSAAAKQAIADGVKASDFGAVYGALAAAAVYARAGHSAAGAAAVKSGLRQLVALRDEDGLFRAASSDDAGTGYHSGLTMGLVADLLETKLLGKAGDAGFDIAQALETLLTSGEQDGDSLAFLDAEEESIDSLVNLRSTSAIAVGAARLARATGGHAALTAELVAQVADYFAAHKLVASAEEAFFLAAGLRTYTEQAPVTPAVISLLAGSVRNGERVRVRVTDVLGRDVEAKKIEVVRAKDQHGAAVAALAGAALTADTAARGVFTLALPADAPLAHGFYTLYLSAQTAAGYADVRGAARTVKLVTRARLADVKVGGAAAPWPKSATSAVEFAAGKPVDVTFAVRDDKSGAALRVQQAFVRLSSSSDGVSAVFVASYNSKAGSYRAKVDVKAAREQLRQVSGTYDVHVIVGDSFVENAIMFRAAAATVSFAGEPVPAPLTIAQSGPLPEIEHQFRQPEPRPHFIVSKFFTLLSLAPLLVLLAGLVRVGANSAALPTGAAFLSAAGFMASLGAILLLYVAYYLWLNMLQTLRLLALLAMPLVFFGHRLLRHLHVARTQSAPSHAKTD